jgi:hypothetical protein
MTELPAWFVPTAVGVLLALIMTPFVAHWYWSRHRR